MSIVDSEHADSSVWDPVFDLTGRVVVITGACGLIGRELVTALQRRGAFLVLVDVDASGPEGFAAQCAGDVVGLVCDVSNSISVQRLAETCLLKYNQVDVLINCHQYKPSGFLDSHPETFSDELWNAIVQVNLTGTFLTCREFGRIMIHQGKGSIINFASTYGVVSSNPALYVNNSMGNPIAYSASKGGVIMMTRYLAVYWAQHGVRVNCITPHGVYNNHEEAFVASFQKMSPMGRMMEPRELVGAVLFLASEASSYVTGSNLLVEGGWTAW